MCSLSQRKNEYTSKLPFSQSAHEKPIVRDVRRFLAKKVP
jgi:hypothetical protein